MFKHGLLFVIGELSHKTVISCLGYVSLKTHLVLVSVLTVSKHVSGATLRLIFCEN